MIRLWVTLLAVFTFLVAGCNSGTQPPTIATGSVIFVRDMESNGYAEVIAGGVSFPVWDTTKTKFWPSPGLIDFEFHPYATIRNDSNVSLDLTATWKFGVMQSIGGKDTFVTTVAGLPDSGVSPNLGTLAPGQSYGITTFQSTRIDTTIHAPFDYLQIDDRLITQRPAYQLTIWNKQGKRLLASTALFDTNDFHKRYRGFYFTTESSPFPEGTVDGPVDPSGGDPALRILPTYPDPTTGHTTLLLNLGESVDSIQADLYITPHHRAARLCSIGAMPPGVQYIQLNMPPVESGLYRLQLIVWKRGTGDYGNYENVCIR
ncbi:MAG: hypothetical protein Q8922_15465 [Bacteroidota bacterium]|nr:hypothetical protein [Bacteroidota bacterium]MDP4234760.1 hypothetical protein [Bacteroidota bacterium]MDP4244151.1 hypothetical protein [Bacteroidota bacterium]MDP4289313.1 hypothetical protein [Bacteroidota bacterium]